MLRSRISLFLRLSAVAGVLLAGCSSTSRLDPRPAAAGASGTMHGGQQPISGVTVQLYAVGTAGDGSSATALLTRAVTTDANGYFNITGLYSCPSASTLVYVTGTGGSPAPGLTNPQIAVMGAIGPCGSLSPSTFLNIDEITTVAAVYALAPFMSSYSAVGSGPSDAAALASAFARAGYFADLTTGKAPGATLPPGYSVPIAQIDTLADLLAACINSNGGVSGDPSVCGQFFALTLPSGTGASTDTIGALLNLAKNPNENTGSLYNLVPPAAPYQPTQPILPVDFALRLSAPSSFTVAPASLSFTATAVGAGQPSQSVTVSNGSASAINLSSAQITGVDAGDFTSAFGTGGDCGAVVAANSTCTIDVSFKPTAAGTRAAYLVLGNSSPNPSLAIALAGTASPAGGPIAPTSASLAFDTSYAAETDVLTNAGSSTVNFSSFTLSSTDYTQSNTCGSSLAAGASCLVTVTPQSGSSPSTQTLTIADDATNQPQTVMLYFNATPGQTPSVDFGHASIGAHAFGIIYDQGRSVGGTYTYTLSGPNAADFSFDSASSLPSTSCTFTRFNNYCTQFVYFAPASQGARVAYVTLQGGGLTSPRQTILLGTADPAGFDFDFSTGPGPFGVRNHISSLNVGSVAIGSGLSSGFSLVNTGTGTPALNAPVISGPNSFDFTVTNPGCPPCSPTVTFTPTTLGNQIAYVTYADTTGAISRTLALIATSLTPKPMLSSSDSLTFSNIPIGTTSAPQSITVTAYQGHPITAALTSTYSGGPQPFVFVGPSSCASTPCTLSIAYAPKTSSDSGVNVYVTATDTVGNSSGNIQAYGQTTPLAAVGVTPRSLTFATQALHTSSAAQSVTLTNIGSTTLNLTFAFDSYANDYTFTNHCPTSLAVNASCTVDVQFTPTDTTGTLSSDLVITGAQYTQYVSLTGTSQ